MRTLSIIMVVSLLAMPDVGRAGGSVPSPKQTESQGNPKPMTTVLPDQILQSGKDDYRAGRFAEAVDELKSAVQRYLPKGSIVADDASWLTTEPQLETAFVYLALADARLGLDADASSAISQLLAAERIKPIYAALPLDDDASDFEPLVARLAPSADLPANRQLARTRGARTTSEAAETKSTTTSGQVPRSSPVASPSGRATSTPAPATTADTTALASVTPSASDASSSSPASTTSTTPLPDFEPPSTSPTPTGEASPAPSTAPMRETSPFAPTSLTQTLPPPDADAVRRMVETLRDADAAAQADRLADADAEYTRVASIPNVPREVLVAAAIGLYRTADFDHAVQAFRKLGPLGRGEEDLRYYDAVALYEIGNFDEALVQLDCALPYIEQSDDVLHYRAKIEGTAAAWAELK